MFNTHLIKNNYSKRHNGPISGHVSNDFTALYIRNTYIRNVHTRMHTVVLITHRSYVFSLTFWSLNLMSNFEHTHAWHLGFGAVDSSVYIRTHTHTNYTLRTDSKGWAINCAAEKVWLYSHNTCTSFLLLRLRNSIHFSQTPSNMHLDVSYQHFC